MVRFPKISIEMRYCKTFYEGQTASRVKEIIQPLHYPFPQPDKILLRLWNKNFPYGDIQKSTGICFQSASRNHVVQMFFLTPNRKVLAGKFVK